ncbi:MAG: hypothetical protein N2044_12105 [Cyclobacteriaceae bacterium]|nr:hypothetical protein [Cyclobacteriaceae bacterium]
MALTKVLITVKTYPTLSAKYDELVCTAGFREDGTWIRLYPVPFRKKPYHEQYKKYDWIEVDVVKNIRDFRPESYRLYSSDTEIKVVGHIGTENNWEERRKICLRKIYHNLTELIAEAKNKEICTSLAVFKPTEILDFYAEPVERNWDKGKLAKLNQLNLFETNKEGKFEVVQKLPYKFKFHFKDNQGIESRMMIEDWETGQLYWNCLARHEGDEHKAIADVRQKYFDDFAKTKDLHFFLGTTQAFHFQSPNPFIIIGTFQPKIELQGKLF